MRKRRYSNSNCDFVSTKSSVDTPFDFWSKDLADSASSASDSDFNNNVNFPAEPPSLITNNPSRFKLSHVVFSLLLVTLIASNLVASRIVNNTLTWFVLAFSFVAFVTLAFFILRFFYRLGFKKITSFLFLPTLIACGFFGANVAAIINDPQINESLLSEMPSKSQYVFYTRDKNGQMLRAFDVSERFVPPAEMWDSWFRRAAIAIEDERFETRYEGVIDARAVARAAIKNLWKWNTGEGGSGIEIQTAKLLTGHYRTKSYLQKAGQGLIALRLDQRFPFPQEKFCLYGNIVDLVSGKRGVGAAAGDLFGVSDLHQLSISQSAVLAAMLQNSAIFNPRTRLAKTKERRDIVLKKMRDLEFISEEQYKAALNEEIKLVPRVNANELLVRAALNFHKLEMGEIQ